MAADFGKLSSELGEDFDEQEIAEVRPCATATGPARYAPRAQTRTCALAPRPLRAPSHRSNLPLLPNRRVPIARLPDPGRRVRSRRPRRAWTTRVDG